MFRPVWYALMLAAIACGLVVTRPRSAAAAASPDASAPAAAEVLTLPEAARLLRVPPDEIARLAGAGCLPGRRLGAQWRFRRTALLAWLAQPETPNECTTAAGLTSDTPASPAAPSAPPPPVSAPPPPASASDPPLPPAQLARQTGRGAGGPVAQATPASPPQPPTVGEKPDLGTAEDIALRGQRVLLKPRELTLELGLFYTRSTRQDIRILQAGDAIAPTLIDLEQDLFTATYTARLGLFKQTQAFASYALVYQTNTLALPAMGRAAAEEHSSRLDSGDLTLGVRHTLFREGVHTPEVILSLEGRLPTGRSSFGVGGGVALVKTFDPMVLFGNVTYLRTFSREFADVTRLQPQGALSASVGYALALNDTLSLSASVAGTFTSDTTFTQAMLRARKRFSLQLGLTALLKEGLPIEPTVSFDLNGPGDTVTLGVSLPYTFGL